MSGFRIENLNYQFEDFILEADFAVQQSERVGISGPSGCGKTTLLRIIAGLEDAGRIRGRMDLSGVDLMGMPPEKREIGFVFQDDALFDSMDVFENIEFGLKLRGVRSEERREHAQTWLRKLGMESFGTRQIGGLSGGEKRRIAIMRALIWKPHLILLDEPFSGLDQKLKDCLVEELDGLIQESRTPLLIVSHDEADLLRLQTRRLQLKLETERGFRRFYE